MTTKDQLIQEFAEIHRLTEEFFKVAPKWFVAISELLAHHQTGAKTTYFVGVNGCQGSGKSTLSEFIQFYLTKTKQLNVDIVSLDDFYFSKQYRQKLADEVHPLFKTRGVPGTHNTDLIKQTLHNIKHNELPLQLPRFDKATDDPKPKEQWPTVTKVPDILIIEGWCWGVPAQQDADLTVPVNALEAKEDPSGEWRTYVNNQLKTQYESLYQAMDFWVMLKAPSFDCVEAWRKEQEHKLAAKTSGVGVMSDAEVERFIQHYQRLTEQGFNTVGEFADIVLQLDSQRQITSCQGQDLLETYLE